MNKDILYSFFSNTATLEQEKQILSWLDESPDNLRKMIVQRKLYDQILLNADEKVLYRAIRRLSIPRWAKEMIRYAAVIMIVVGVGSYYVANMQKKLMLATNKISVPAGQHVNIVLPDGTKVCMNALSEIVYPAFFSGDSRKVKLTGEAFFDVVHDESHPFIVETFACDVEVLGTKFNVMAYPNTNQFVTSLVEGKVKVIDRNDPVRMVVLGPDEQVSYLGDRFLVDRIPEYESFQWRDGLIVFHDAAFMELIEEFEKYYGVRIEVERKHISQNMFTGKIRISEGVDHALWVLQQSSDFTYVRNETKDIIYIK